MLTEVLGLGFQVLSSWEGVCGRLPGLLQCNYACDAGSKLRMGMRRDVEKGSPSYLVRLPVYIFTRTTHDAMNASSIRTKTQKTSCEYVFACGKRNRAHFYDDEHKLHSTYLKVAFSCYSFCSPRR